MIDHLEKLMLEHFSTIPFHNLSLLYGEPYDNKILGGTCSDKTLAFLSDARDSGVDAQLHTAYIGGKEIHRLIRVSINGRSFYADVGNGWPALRLFPEDEEIFFECFGMKYRTEIKHDWLYVFHEKQGRESLQMSIHRAPRPESEILNEIGSRFTSGIIYPFSNSLRFSLIVGDEFLFLRGAILERHSKLGFSLETVDEKDIPDVIQQEFGCDVSSYFNKVSKSHSI